MNLTEDFVSLLPEKPYCARWKGEMLITSRDKAAKYPLVQPNHPCLQRFIALDLDRSDAALLAHDSDIPPNLAMVNPENGHAHLLYWLDKPIWIKPDAPAAKPVRYLQAVRRGLTKTFKSDIHYNGALVKNPLHPAWRTYTFRSEPYSLGDIAKHVDLSVPRTSIDDTMEMVRGQRHTALFNNTRRWAYQNYHLFHDRGEWDRAVLAAAEHFNDCEEPLQYSEVKATARSVSRWVWTNYIGTGRVRRPKMEGIMNLDPAMPLGQRQKAGQAYVAAQRSASTLDSIMASVRALESIGVRPTQKAISDHCGRSLVTVKRYWKEVGIIWSSGNSHPGEAIITQFSSPVSD